MLFYIVTWTLINENIEKHISLKISICKANFAVQVLSQFYFRKIRAFTQLQAGGSESESPENKKGGFV